MYTLNLTQYYSQVGFKTMTTFGGDAHPWQIFPDKDYRMFIQYSASGLTVFMMQFIIESPLSDEICILLSTTIEPEVFLCLQLGRKC